jgi:hypothetical protein
VRRRVRAIAGLTLREAVRSRLVAAMCLLLGVTVLALPPLLKGDGTPEGLARLMLNYTLGAAFGLLALATLWTSCAAVSGEVAGGTLPALRVRPVPAWQLWLGKWLGILLLDAILLAGTLAAASLSLSLRLARVPAAAAAVRLARAACRPELPPLETELRAELERLAPLVPPGKLPRLRAQLRRELPYRPAVIEPDRSRSWRFRLDAPPDTRHPLWLRLRFDTDAFTRAVVKADCRLWSPEDGSAVDFRLDDFSLREFEVQLPAAPFAGRRLLELRMTHAGDETAGPLLLQPRQGLVLLLPRGSLAGNLLRAAAVEMALLALLAALGVTCGALFSLPVAAFCATGLLLATMISSFVMSDPGAEDYLREPGARPWRRTVSAAAAAVTRALAAAARPAIEPAPLRQLAQAELIPAATATRCWLVNGLLIPALCGGVAAAAVARREFGG